MRNLDTPEARDILAVRATLETLAAQILCALETMDVEAKRSIEEGVKADFEFHRTLYRLSGNESLLHAWEPLEGAPSACASCGPARSGACRT